MGQNNLVAWNTKQHRFEMSTVSIVLLGVILFCANCYKWNCWFYNNKHSRPGSFRPDKSSIRIPTVFRFFTWTVSPTWACAASCLVSNGMQPSIMSGRTWVLEFETWPTRSTFRQQLFWLGQKIGIWKKTQNFFFFMEQTNNLGSHKQYPDGVHFIKGFTPAWTQRHAKIWWREQIPIS